LTNLCSCCVELFVGGNTPGPVTEFDLATDGDHVVDGAGTSVLGHDPDGAGLAPIRRVAVVYDEVSGQRVQLAQRRDEQHPQVVECAQGTVESGAGHGETMFLRCFFQGGPQAQQFCPGLLLRPSGDVVGPSCGRHVGTCQVECGPGAYQRGGVGQG